MRGAFLIFVITFSFLLVGCDDANTSSESSKSIAENDKFVCDKPLFIKVGDTVFKTSKEDNPYYISKDNETYRFETARSNEKECKENITRIAQKLSFLSSGLPEGLFRLQVFERRDWHKSKYEQIFSKLETTPTRINSEVVSYSGFGSNQTFYVINRDSDSNKKTETKLAHCFNNQEIFACDFMFEFNDNLYMSFETYKDADNFSKQIERALGFLTERVWTSPREK